MKAILVAEMPKNCAECKLMYLQGIGEAICNAVDWDERPSWCPLKPMPKKKETDSTGTIDEYMLKGYDRGWNDCIEEIENEQNES